jgi:hypothetical protein
MTVNDVAVDAMESLIIAGAISGTFPEPDVIARRAFEIARAMLKESMNDINTAIDDAVEQERRNTYDERQRKSNDETR